MFFYILSNDKIEFLYVDYINNVLNWIIKKYKLKLISLYGFRYIYVIFMFEIGIDFFNILKCFGYVSS